MKVILLRDVAKLGRRFSVTNVPDGYALNKLIPQGMAEPATPENLKKVAARTDKYSKDAALSEEAFKAACEDLKTRPIELSATANDQGHLFKAVKAADIAVALKASGITSISEDMIILTDPIKSVGDHEVALKYHNASGTLNLKVNSK